MFPLFQIGTGTLPNLNIPDLSNVNIAELIFGILKVSPTGDTVSDLVNLIFFPHVVIILWLSLVYFYSEYAANHKGISLLLAFAFYFFVVWNGWYTFIAAFSQLWLVLTVGISLFYFVFSRFIHPGATAARGKIMGAVGGKIWERRQVDKAVDRMKKDIVQCDEELRKLNQVYAEATRGDERRAIEESRNAWRLRKMDLEAKIRELEKQKQWV